jgi:hypothetical protein
MRYICDQHGPAYLMADMAHIAGLVAGKLIPSPFPYCDMCVATIPTQQNESDTTTTNDDDNNNNNNNNNNNQNVDWLLPPRRCQPAVRVATVICDSR